MVRDAADVQQVSVQPVTVQQVSVQQVLQRLAGFWERQGCATLPPCSLEVPAALLHPKSFFRLLDPQPWRVQVAQPVTRPADGRRGRHPFRTSVHLQVHVALKDPEPASVRQRVLASLEDLGVVIADHHLRLDDFRWGLAAVGAGGRGWRLLLDGVGIGRIIFLDRLADRTLERTTVDVTYGLEHLAMALGEVDSVYRLPWQGPLQQEAHDGEGTDPAVAPPTAPPSLRYDQLRRRDEEEASRYVEEVASVEHLRQVLGGLEHEARRCLDAGLVRPSYERAIQCLAVLDVLEVRGDLTPAERVQQTETVRALVAGAAECYLERHRTASPAPPPAQTSASTQDGDDVVDEISEAAADSESDESDESDMDGAADAVTGDADDRPDLDAAADTPTPIDDAPPPDADDGTAGSAAGSTEEPKKSSGKRRKRKRRNG